MNAQKRYALFASFEKHNPHPATELYYTRPFELLMAVMLSAQMTDKGVNKITPALFAVANTPSKIMALGEKKLSDFIKSVNYYKTKARHIVQASEQLIKNFGGEIPHNRADLQTLPGVGRKTANVLLSILGDEPVMAVDTHIFRVAHRTGLVKNCKTPLAVENQLVKVIPGPFLKHAHHWLVLHGRYVCKARKPLCQTCVIKPYCEYPQKTP